METCLASVKAEKFKILLMLLLGKGVFENMEYCKVAWNITKAIVYEK